MRQQTGRRDTGLNLVVVLPCYNVESQVEEVIRSLPSWVTHAIAVNDASTDGTAEVLEGLAAEIPRLHVVGHPSNRGVGGAMVTGFREAMRAGADLVVKVDGDGQMDIADLPVLLRPLLEGRADYAKGNRFRHVKDLDHMPRMRLLGNIALTFMTKMASGYWHVFDAQNGYLAITREALESLPLEKIDHSYAFENSMLSLLNIENRPVVDVAMPAIYADEVSSMSLAKVVFSFPPKLFRMFLRRLFLKYVIYDVSPVSLYTLFGSVFLLFGLLFGGYHWWQSILTGVPAPTGTVVLALLTFLMGFILFLQAVNLDIINSPRPRSPERAIEPEDVPGFF
jgi:glycosyltransferase involved in cell wall biosynthesis